MAAGGARRIHRERLDRRPGRRERQFVLPVFCAGIQNGAFLYNLICDLEHAIRRLLEVVGHAVAFGVEAAEHGDDVQHAHRRDRGLAGFFRGAEQKLGVIERAVRIRRQRCPKKVYLFGIELERPCGLGIPGRLGIDQHFVEVGDRVSFPACHRRLEPSRLLRRLLCRLAHITPLAWSPWLLRRAMLRSFGSNSFRA